MLIWKDSMNVRSINQEQNRISGAIGFKQRTWGISGKGTSNQYGSAVGAPRHWWQRSSHFQY